MPRPGSETADSEMGGCSWLLPQGGSVPKEKSTQSGFGAGQAPGESQSEAAWPVAFAPGRCLTPPSPVMWELSEVLVAMTGLVDCRWCIYFTSSHFLFFKVAVSLQPSEDEDDRPTALSLLSAEFNLSGPMFDPVLGKWLKPQFNKPMVLGFQR